MSDRVGYHPTFEPWVVWLPGSRIGHLERRGGNSYGRATLCERSVRSLSDSSAWLQPGMRLCRPCAHRLDEHIARLMSLSLALAAHGHKEAHDV